MDNLNHHRHRIFKGAGWLLGITISMISAIVVIILFGSYTIAISATTPMGVVIGMSLEQKFQGKSELVNSGKNKVTIGLLLFGFIVFAVFVVFQYLM